MRLCKKMKWLPMLTVNLGTGTPEEACNWLEYCNSPAGSQYADLRFNHGSHQPHSVKLWCLGNEMDGYWQQGHVPVEEYSVRAQRAAMMMKAIDPGIEVVVCGSSNPWMSTFSTWDRQVLEKTGDLVDYISLHCYVGNSNDDTLDYLAITNIIDRQIEDIDGVCRSVQAKRRSPKRAFLSFDEWNVWYRDMHDDGKGQVAPHLLEEVYNLEDALVVAGFLLSFIRHADVLKIANLAQIVNVIAPIQTNADEMFIQTIFYPFEMISRRKNGSSLQPFVKGPMYTGKSNGEVAFIDCAAILDQSLLHIFITNRNTHDSAPVIVDVAPGKIKTLGRAEILTGPDPKVANSFKNPRKIRSRQFRKVEINDGKAHLNLPPLSFSALSFELE
jgi:alpha-N-arabinofuranosidase